MDAGAAGKYISDLCLDLEGTAGYYLGVCDQVRTDNTFIYLFIYLFFAWSFVYLFAYDRRQGTKKKLHFVMAIM